MAGSGGDRTPGRGVEAAVGATSDTAPETAPDEVFDRFTDALDPPLLVVTVADGRDRDGCVVGFHSQCSLDPLRYALWLSRANRTYRVALRSEYLGIHLLGPDDRALGEWFGGHTGDREDPFAGVDTEPGPGGVPLLRSATTRFVAVRVGLVDVGGDHACFVVEPVAGHAADPGPRDGLLRVSDLAEIEPGHPG